MPVDVAAKIDMRYTNFQRFDMAKRACSIICTPMARIVVIHEIARNHKRVRESLPEHEILAFKQLPSATRFLEKNSADLIISAVHLTEGNVFDFLHWVKADSRLCSIPFVFFCAEPTELAKYVSGAVKSAAQILGASRYMAMDIFDEAAFRATIQEVLESEVPTITARQLQALKAWASTLRDSATSPAAERSPDRR
jgi:CheY-like chemotaxis protein